MTMSFCVGILTGYFLWLHLSRHCMPSMNMDAQVGAIVPWNYPFHNVFNPLSAAIFAGNAIVIKVSRQTVH